MSSISDTEGATSNLKHVYVFMSQEVDQNRGVSNGDDSIKWASDVDSQACSETYGLDDISYSSVLSENKLNPLAHDFTPSSILLPTGTTTALGSNGTDLPPLPVRSSNFELRRTATAGFGLFATASIKRGTCIISEEPLLTIRENEFHLVWEQYSMLKPVDKTTFDSLHCFVKDRAAYEASSYMHLINPNLKESEIAAQVEQHVRVMGIFNCNDFMMSSANYTLGVFPTACRLNHSCIPNVHHSYNPNLKQLTIHAICDILPGEEIFTNYLGGMATYIPSAERKTKLHHSYGFMCCCKACDGSFSSIETDGRRELMDSLVSGLAAYLAGAQPTNQFIPKDPIEALSQAEDLISCLIEEGTVHLELAKAYRTASMEAAKLGRFDIAFEYAFDELEVEHNCLGSEISDLKKQGSATQCWIDRLRSYQQLSFGPGLSERDLNVMNAKPTKGKSKAQKQKQKAKEKRQRLKEEKQLNVGERNADSLALEQANVGH